MEKYLFVTSSWDSDGIIVFDNLEEAVKNLLESVGNYLELTPDEIRDKVDEDGIYTDYDTFYVNLTEYKTWIDSGSDGLFNMKIFKIDDNFNISKYF